MSSVFKLLTTPSLLWSFISLFLLSSLLINQAAGSRLLKQPDLVVDLNVTNFDAVLKDNLAKYAIVEFYAHWCPACRNFKLQYEKVASLFNGADAVYPGTLLMTRVDCAIKVNANLCKKFSVNHYPMFFWGTPSSFVAGSLDGRNEKSEIRLIDHGRTANSMLKWINTQLGSSYSFGDEILYHGNDELLQSNVAYSGQREI